MEENITEYCNGLRVDTFTELKHNNTVQEWYYESVMNYGAALNEEEQEPTK